MDGGPDGAQKVRKPSLNGRGVTSSPSGSGAPVGTVTAQGLGSGPGGNPIFAPAKLLRCAPAFARLLLRGVARTYSRVPHGRRLGDRMGRRLLLRCLGRVIQRSLLLGTGLVYPTISAARMAASFGVSAMAAPSHTPDWHDCSSR